MKRLLVLVLCVLLTSTGVACSSNTTNELLSSADAERVSLQEMISSMSNVMEERLASVKEEEEEKLAEASLAASKEVEEYEAQINSLSSEKDDYFENVLGLSSALADLSEEYGSYVESMSAYEDLAEAEIVARSIEVEAIIASSIAQSEAESQSKKESEQASRAAVESSIEASKAAAEASRAEEERIGYETGITYDQLARTPDDYEGKKVKFTGEVAQVIEYDDETDLRIAVNGDYNLMLYCGYDPSILSYRILEDDTVTIYGVSVGLYSYTSTLGATITIPCVWVDKIERR